MRSHSLLCLILTMLLHLSAGAKSRLPEPLDYVTIAHNYEPMEMSSIDRELRNILGAYYQQSFGGVGNWQRIESVRLEGTLSTPQGELPFVVFKKKPSSCKIVIQGDDGPLMLQSYDGRDAWQLIPSQAPDAVDMPPAEALNFIREAIIGSHLLYPEIPGKQIIYEGSEKVDGVLCRKLSVALPNGDAMIYLMDYAGSTIRQQIVHNLRLNHLEITQNHEFKEVEGVSIATHRTMSVNGETMHEISISKVEFNLGVMPWMFSRPSGAFIPGPSEKFSAVPDITEITQPNAPLPSLVPSFDFSK